MIDSHAHITRPEYANDIDEVISRAKAAGVTHLINVVMGPDILEINQGFEACVRPEVFMALGIHPHDAHLATPDVLSQMRTHLQDERVRVVGEIGLDYYYTHSPREAQRDCFDAFLGFAAQIQKPISVHTREAFEDTLAHIRAHRAKLPNGVIHCFTGTTDQARKFLDQGLYISFSGVVTFKKAQDIVEAARFVPLDRLLIETDAPFLAPVPHRGHRNEPAYVSLVAQHLATIKGVSVEEVARQTYNNTLRAFALPLDELPGP